MENSKLKLYILIGALIILSFLVISCEADWPMSSPKIIHIVDPQSLNLGVVETFAVLGGDSGIINMGTSTVIAGDIGTTGSSIIIKGFHNTSFSYMETSHNLGKVNGEIYSAAPQGTAYTYGIAYSAVNTAAALFKQLELLPNGIDTGTSGQLGGLLLSGCVYKSATGDFRITGLDLTLDGKGNTDSVWVFQMSHSLIVGDATSPRHVILINGAQAKNVYWQVGTDARINESGGGVMSGTIIAGSEVRISSAGNEMITVLNGRALSLNAPVSMVNTVINPFATIDSDK